MRNVTILSVALVVGMGLAGCLNGGTTTAKDNLGKALELGAAWQAGAVLEGVFAVELGDVENATKELEAAQEEGMDDGELQLALALLQKDPSVGVVRAPAWLYGFRSASRELVLVLDAGGSVTYRNETIDEDASEEDSDSSSVSDRSILTEIWKIDSDRASDLAAAANGTFAALQGRGEQASSVLVQGPSAKHPVWIMFVHGAIEGNEASIAMAVDANNGTAEPLGLFGFDYSPYANYTINLLEQEDGTVSGSLNVVQPDASEEFSIESGEHQELNLALVAENGVPINQVTAVITAPDGTETSMTVTGSLAFTGSPEMATIESPLAGDYTVRFHLDQGAQQNYRLDWCTDGFGLNFNPFGQGNAAC